MSRVEQPDLLADIGGTNARFALARSADYGPVRRYAVADFPDLASAIRMFLRDISPAEPPCRAALAFAEESELVDAEVISQAENVINNVTVGEGLFVVDRLAVAAVIERDHPVAGVDDLRCQRFKCYHIQLKRVRGDDNWAAAGVRVVDFLSVDGRYRHGVTVAVALVGESVRPATGE